MKLGQMRMYLINSAFCICHPQLCTIKRLCTQNKKNKKNLAQFSRQFERCGLLNIDYKTLFDVHMHRKR